MGLLLFSDFFNEVRIYLTVKRHEDFFWEYFLFFSKRGKCTIFEHKINLFQNFSLNEFISFFWNCTWWQTLEIGYLRKFLMLLKMGKWDIFGTMAVAGRVLWIGLSFHVSVQKFSCVWSLVFENGENVPKHVK